MLQNFRGFLGTPIRDRLTKGLLGRVSDLVVNPTNGEILAVFVRHDRKLLVPTTDITRVAAGEAWVESPEALAKPDEIVRIAEVLAQNAPIYGNKVFTVGRIHLGTVIDYQFETNGWVLTRLEVAKKILGIPTERKLINTSQIIHVKPTEITVRDAVVEVRGKRVRASETLNFATPSAACVKILNSKCQAEEKLQ